MPSFGILQLASKFVQNKTRTKENQHEKLALATGTIHYFPVGKKTKHGNVCICVCENETGIFEGKQQVRLDSLCTRICMCVCRLVLVLGRVCC